MPDQANTVALTIDGKPVTAPEGMTGRQVGERVGGFARELWTRLGR